MHLAAIEIGGTKLQVGVGTEDGELLTVERAQVQPGWDAAEIRDTVSSLLARALSKLNIDASDLGAAGIGFGGPVDAENGVVIKSHHVPGWDNFPLARWFRDVWGIPVVLHNDADTAGLGEAVRGAGKNYDPVFYITLGTGVGGGPHPPGSNLPRLWPRRRGNRTPQDPSGESA